MKKPGRHPILRTILIIVAVVLLAGIAYVMFAFKNVANEINQSTSQESMELPAVSKNNVPMKPLLKSGSDYNANGVDDYTDFVKGAKLVAEQHPVYDDGYYQGGYPPAGKGACTDLIADAFKTAGYDLKSMVDADIAANPTNYPQVSTPDPNIDYRRTGTLNQFFKLHAQSLTTDVKDTQAWQQGDIVVFETTRHIGMVGNTRDAHGIAYLIHNNRQKGSFEEAYLARVKRYEISGHYRFDATNISTSILKAAKS